MPHFKYDIIKRSEGCNILATLSYQSRKSVRDYNNNNKIKKSYTHGEDLKESKLFLPAGSDERYKNPEALWNAVNDVCNDRLIIRGQLPKQREMSYEHYLECVERFCYESAGKFNCPWQYFIHKAKATNDNIHAHIMLSLNPIIDGKIGKKSEKIYLDDDDNVIHKVNTPVLKRGKLQFNPDGTIKTRPGWQTLVLNDKGEIQYDEKGRVLLKDIRRPLLDDSGNQITYYNGKNKKTSKEYRTKAWKEFKIRFTELESLKEAESEKGYRYEARMLWQQCINDIYKKYNYRDTKGELLQVDLRSYAEQDQNKLEHEKRLAGEHIGHDQSSEYKRERNEIREKINAGIEIEIKEPIPYEDLQNAYNERQASRNQARILVALSKNKEKIRSIEKQTKELFNEQQKFYNQINPRQLFIDSAEARNEGKNSNVTTSAGIHYDQMTNEEKVSLVNAFYGEAVATVVGHVLERTTPDNTEALDGLDEIDIDHLFNFDISLTLTERITESVTDIFDRIKNRLTTEEKPHKTTLEQQIDTLIQKDNYSFYSDHQELLKERLIKQADVAEYIIKESENRRRYTKEGYYIVSDTRKAYKEFLQIRMAQKSKKNLSDIEKLRSKEFQSLAMKLGLKRDFMNYDKWLNASKIYFANLGASEKIKRRQSPVPDRIYEPSFQVSSVGLSIFLDVVGKSVDFKLKWYERDDDHQKNAMEKAEEKMYKGYENMIPIIVLPPDSKQKNCEYEIKR